MLEKYFSIIRNYVLSVSSQRKYNFYHRNTLLDAFRTNSRNIIGGNPSMVIPLLANQDFTPLLRRRRIFSSHDCGQCSGIVHGWLMATDFPANDWFLTSEVKQ